MRILYLQANDSCGGTKRSLEVMCSYVTSPVVRYVAPGWRPHERKSLLTFLRWAVSFKWWDILKIRGDAAHFDIVHLNHESLIWYAVGMKKPVVCHIRTQWPRNLMGYLFRAVVFLLADAIVCISPNELRCTGYPLVSIISNIAMEKDTWKSA